MKVLSTSGQRPGSTLYHIGDGFYFRINRQHFKTIYMRCCSPGCKVTGSMASDSTKRNRIKTAGQHNHPPDIHKYELLAFSERLYQRCRTESTPLRIIFQEEIQHAPARIRPLLVMAHYLKRMQNLRKRLRAQSLRAKINLSLDDSVLLYEDGTPIKDSAEEVSNTNNTTLNGVNYPSSDLKDNEKKEKPITVELQSTNVSSIEQDDDSKTSDEHSNKSPKKIYTHGFDWTEPRMYMLLDTMKLFYGEVLKQKDQPKRVWEDIAREIDPDVKWYTVRKKWTQLELGYRTYMKDLKETGDRALYRPAYLEEIGEIINDNEDETVDALCPKRPNVEISIEPDNFSDDGNCDDTRIQSKVNTDHPYSCLDSKQIRAYRNELQAKKIKNELNDRLVNTLLKIHKEQLDESRKRLDAIMSVLEETRKESKETTECIKRLTDAIIQKFSIPSRIVVAQKRSHS